MSIILNGTKSDKIYYNGVAYNKLLGNNNIPQTDNYVTNIQWNHSTYTEQFTNTRKYGTSITVTFANNITSEEAEKIYIGTPTLSFTADSNIASSSIYYKEDSYPIYTVKYWDGNKWCTSNSADA